jgi:hypothetical protein
VEAAFRGGGGEAGHVQQDQGVVVRGTGGGTLAVAVFGAMISHQASFLPGMRASLLIAVIVLFAATAAAFTLPRYSSSGVARK